MATAADIERITTLIQQLAPLASRHRGELIEAEHWNTVVSTLMEVARAVLADDEQQVPAHDHPDQVSSGWLDPKLRAQLDKGALADPISVARVAKLERRLASQNLSLDKLRAELGIVRSVASRVETADLDRKSSLTRLARKLEGLGDSRDGVSDVRTTLEVLRSDLDQVTSFARGLEVDGETVSVAKLVERIEGIEGLRERLTGPNGEELNATSFELRLAALTETLVTETELDQALGDSSGGGSIISDALRAQLLEASTLAAREQVDASTSDLEGRLNGRIAARIAEVETTVMRAAVARSEEVMDGVRATLRGELAADIKAGDDAVRGTIDGALADLQGGLRTELDERIGGVRTELGNSIDRRITESLPRLTDELQASLDALSAQVDPLDQRMAGLQRSVSKVAGETDALRRDLGTRSEELAKTLGRDIETAIAKVVATANSNDTALTNTLRAELAAERLRVDGSIAKLNSGMQAVVDAGVKAASENMLTTMREEVDTLGKQLDRQVTLSVTKELERRTTVIGNNGPINSPILGPRVRRP